MEGPGPNQPKRRAGDSNTPYNTSSLKAWQQNTWYGPAPIDNNPFEEPENAPELLEQRSENIRDKSGEFWQESKPEGYKSPAGTGKHRTKSRTSGKKKRRRPGMVMTAAMVLVGLGLVTCLILYFFVFRVTEIVITGNTLIDEGDIRRYSGIKIGDSTLTLDEDEVAKRMMSEAATAGNAAIKNDQFPKSYLLEFRYMEVKMPGTVTIAVREREPCCRMSINGIWVVTDKHRLVLYESQTEFSSMKIGEEQKDLILVNGLDIRIGANSPVGQRLMLKSSAQESAFDTLFLEMKVLNCGDRIEEADLSNPESILLKTKDGYTVSIGNGERIHAKLRSMLLVLDEVGRMVQAGKTKPEGRINVITPETPYYTPPTV